MESKRQHRFSKQIQKDLSEILQKDALHFYGSRLVTVTEVSMSPDLGLARVYISVLPNADQTIVLESMDAKKSEIRGKLGRKIGKQVRIVPELAFFGDDTNEKASHMDRLIDSLDIPPESPDQEPS